MNTIYLKSAVLGTSTNAEGFSLQTILKPYIQRSETVAVSFAETTAMSSSFFNSSFGELIDEFGIGNFKLYIKPIEITKSQLELVRKYIDLHKNHCVL